MTFLIGVATIAVIFVCLYVIDSLVAAYLSISLLYLLYLIFTGKLKHHLEKRRLVVGDLVIIRYRGKFRKAYITSIMCFTDDNKVQLEFDERALNIKLIEHNWYPLSRIIIPEYLGKTAKLLFSEMEIKNE